MLPGPILIADRGNNRLIEVDPYGRVVWEFPRPADLAPHDTFNVPDDAFFTPDGKQIIATQEDDFVVTLIDIATHKIVWRYGTPGTSGAGSNQLWNPDDAIMLRDGHIIVSDIKNCRVLLLAPGEQTPLRQLGRTGHCSHRTGTRFSSPNGAFPQPDGRILVTEIGGSWVTSMSLGGVVSWSTHAPGVSYPSDTNQIGSDRYLTVDYSPRRQDRRVRPHRSPALAIRTHRTRRARQAIARGTVTQRGHPRNRRRQQSHHRYRSDNEQDRLAVRPHRIAGRQTGYLSDPDGADIAPPHSLTFTSG